MFIMASIKSYIFLCRSVAFVSTEFSHTQYARGKKQSCRLYPHRRYRIIIIQRKKKSTDRNHVLYYNTPFYAISSIHYIHTHEKRIDTTLILSFCCVFFIHFKLVKSAWIFLTNFFLLVVACAHTQTVYVR